MASAIGVTGGSDPSEVSWTLTCSGTCAPITGGAPYDAAHMLPPNASCTLDMADSYGDGWSGNSFSAPGWLAAGVAYSIASGGSGTAAFIVPSAAVTGPVASPPPPPTLPVQAEDASWISSEVSEPG